MHFHVLAVDYDGTIAENERVDQRTIDALDRVRRSGRRVVLVTGRELPDLQRVGPDLEIFDLVVAENGGLLYYPERREERLLCEPADARLADELRRRGASPLSVGRTIVATWEPHGETALEAIRDLGLELQVIFNKGAVMILPSGVNKRSGLEQGLLELGLSPHNAVGVGDAENDHMFLAACECGAAVANAIPALKERADLLLEGDHGSGIVELVDRYLVEDMRPAIPLLSRRHRIRLGVDKDGTAVTIPALSSRLLVTGGSGSGKSLLAGLVIERLIDDGRSVLVVDPEGDYRGLADSSDVVVLSSDTDHEALDPRELVDVAMLPGASVVLDLHTMTMTEKTEYVTEMLRHLESHRHRTGRPHWIVVDEAHHVAPTEGSAPSRLLAGEYDGLALIAFDPRLVATDLLRGVTTILSRTADELRLAITAVAEAGEGTWKVPEDLDRLELDPQEGVMASFEGEGTVRLVRFLPDERRTEHHRHIRKYATGELAEEKSFFFRGPRDAMRLRAANLVRFCELARGIDDETWLFHLHRKDYSAWVRQEIGDGDLAAEIEEVEESTEEPGGTREAICERIARRYAV